MEMFYFSIFRTVFTVRETVKIDNMYIFYFVKEIESRFKRRICPYTDGVCEECNLKNICIFPKIFLSESWYKKPNLMIVSPKNLNETLTEGSKFKIDFIMLNEAVDSFRLLEEAIRESSKEAMFTNLVYEDLYNYNPFADTVERVNLLSPFPKYRVHDFSELRSGARRVKLKIYPSFLNISFDPENLSDGELKFFLFKEFLDRVSDIFEEDVQFPDTLNLNLEKIFWKKLEYKDLILTKTISNFKNYNFFTGEFIVEGDLASIWYIFEFIQIFGIGKLTNYGFGKVKPIILL